jgi:hypothetical protein
MTEPRVRDFSRWDTLAVSTRALARAASADRHTPVPVLRCRIRTEFLGALPTDGVLNEWTRRRGLWLTARERMRERDAFLVSKLGKAAIAMPFSVICYVLLVWSETYPAISVGIVGTMIIASFQIWRRTRRAALSQHLVTALQKGNCPRCGYELNMAPPGPPHCPECAEPWPAVPPADVPANWNR